jgi:glycosyltransferase involved in cell wall biosynthesis
VNAPTVSVCIPAYNAARFIREAVTSVLTQTFEDLELVVVDDASSDGTADIVEELADGRVRVMRNAKNLGAAGNWNRAMELTGGRFVKLLCNDDYLRPTCLEEQVASLESHPEVVLTAAKRNVVDEAGRVLLRDRGLTTLEGVVDGPMAIRATVRSGTNIFGEPVCVLMRKEAVLRCGPFTRELPYMIDVEYWTRLLRLGSLYALPHTLGAFRVVSTSLSVQLARRQASEAITLFRRLQAEHPTAVGRGDLVMGAGRAAVLASGRGAIYRLLGARARRGRP